MINKKNKVDIYKYADMGISSKYITNWKKDMQWCSRFVIKISTSDIHIICIIQKLARVVAARREVSSNNGIGNILLQPEEHLIPTRRRVLSTAVQSCLPLQASRWSLGALLLNGGPDLYSFDDFLLLTPYERLNWKKNTILKIRGIAAYLSFLEITSAP